MCVDLYIFVETRSATSRWRVTFQRAETCIDCEGTGEEQDDEAEDAIGMLPRMSTPDKIILHITRRDPIAKSV